MLLGSNKRNFGHALHGKPYFLFPDVLKRWFLKNKSRWNMIFVVLSRKMIFLFPKNMILHVRRKMEDDLSQKNTLKYDILFKRSEKMVFSKRAAQGHDLSCIIWKDSIFFPKTWYFFRGRKVRLTFLKKYMEIWYFLCTRAGVTNVAPRPSVKKIQRWSYPAKIHLKVINVLDWHSRKSSNNSLYFYGDLYRRFHVLLSSEKSQQN